MVHRHFIHCALKRTSFPAAYAKHEQAAAIRKGRLRGQGLSKLIAVTADTPTNTVHQVVKN